MWEHEVSRPVGEAPPRDHRPKFYHAAEALSAHSASGTNAEVALEADGIRRSIWGPSTPLVQEGVLVVVLYSDDTTMSNRKIHPDAEVNFLEAACRLLQDGTEFYTVLRPAWALRAILWTREYR